MKTSIITAAIAILALSLFSCTTTYTKETLPDGTVRETKVTGIDPAAGGLAGTAAEVVISTQSSK